jgi:hypothetical protein
VTCTHAHADFLATPRASAVDRIKELTIRIEKAAIKKATRHLAIDKERVLRELMDNLERGKTVKGGSSVVNRACELIGEHLGMFQDRPPKKLTLEGLTTDELRELLGDARRRSRISSNKQQDTLGTTRLGRAGRGFWLRAFPFREGSLACRPNKRRPAVARGELGTLSNIG